jgi:hypothetical protein
MKQHNDHIEAEVMKTLKLLDEMPVLKVHHLFRVKLMQRVDDMQQSSARKGNGALSLNVRLAFMALLLLVNIASAVLFIRSDKVRPLASLGGNASEWFSDDYASPALAYYAQPANDQTAADEQSRNE